MHPILLKLGPITIFTYGFFLALGFLAAIYTAAREAGRTGIPVGRFYDLSFYVVLWAIIGSRLLHVILEWPYFLAHPVEIFFLWKGGLVFHGGVAGSLGAVLVYCYRHGLSWRGCLDAFGLGMPVGQFFGRIGCFMAGCCYGKPSDLPWAVTFTHPESLCPLREALHPAQLYETLMAAGMFGILYWFRTRKRYEGQLILTYFCLAGLVRFTVEFFRHPGDYRGPVFLGFMPLTQAIALSIAIICGGVLLWNRARRRPASGGRPD